MNRRELMVLLGSMAVAVPLGLRAQQSGPMRRIGVLMGLADSDSEAQSDIAALRGGLEELGWREGRNIVIDLRWSGGDADRMRVLAAELVSLQPEVVVGHTNGADNRAATSGRHNTNRVHPGLRSNRQRLHREPGKPGRQPDRVQHV
jgi:hypothetical protein